MSTRACEKCGTTTREVQRATSGAWTCVDCYETTVSTEMPPEMSPLASSPRHLSGDDDISLVKPSRDARAVGAHGTDKTAARARQLGIYARLGRRGPCILPGHDDHSARTVPDGKGRWNYFCPACDRSFSLGEVRAIIAYEFDPYDDDRDVPTSDAWRSIRPPGRIEMLRWADLLDYEAGLRRVRPTPIVVPSDLTPAARKVAEGVRLLLGLRPEEWDGTFTFSRRFCRAWCGLSDAAARSGVTDLRHRGVIIPVGRAGRAITYRLGRGNEVDADDGTILRDQALVDCLIKTFDAVVLRPDGES